MKISANLAKVKKLQFEFEEFTIEQLPKRENSYADMLANLRSSISSEYRRTVLVEINTHSSIINIKDMWSTKNIDGTWLDPILSYIQNKNWAVNELEAQKVLGIALKYTILDEQLYKCSY